MQRAARWLLLGVQLLRAGRALVANLADDAYYMRLAMDQARLAAEQNEVPIGAIVVSREGVVEAAAFNQVEMRADASAHAELICMRMAASHRRNWRLLDATLFCTLEPCAMCLSAAYAFRIKRIVYAAPDIRLGAVRSWIRLPQFQHPFHSIDIDAKRLRPQVFGSKLIRAFSQAGTGEAESAALLRDFFARRRSDLQQQRIASSAIAARPGSDQNTASEDL